MSKHQHIISNFYAFFEYLSIHSNSELKIEKHFSSVMTKNSVWPNFTFNLKLESSSAKTQLEKIIALIDKNLIPNYIIIDETDVTQHEALLMEAGFIPLVEWACLELVKEGTTLAEQDSEFKIKEVETKEDLKQWVKVAGNGFGELDFSLFNKCFKNNEVIFYSGYYQSEIVSTALLFFENDTAGIYHVVTLPEYRKKGFGSQLYKHCQKEARKKGAKRIISQSTQEGLNAWKNTGMEQYGKFYLFCWNNPKS